MSLYHGWVGRAAEGTISGPFPQVRNADAKAEDQLFYFLRTRKLNRWLSLLC